VAAQDQIDAIGLEDRQRVLAHLDQLSLGVGIMRSFAVRRVMPKGDHPIGTRVGRGRDEIAFQPGQHGAADGAVGAVGVQHNEVDIAEIEGVIGLGARVDAAAEAIGRGLRGQREDVVVRDGAADRVLVIAPRRPER
jgi:hypothetical protein